MKRPKWLHNRSLLVSFLTAAASCIFVTQAAELQNGLVIWDTGHRLADDSGIRTREGWKAIPSELFTFEANPQKAASDPGYYGREYSFTGDAVVENQFLTAVFCATKGRLILYSKGIGKEGSRISSENTGCGTKVGEIVPLQVQGEAHISHVEILRNAGDEAALEITFGSAQSGNITERFSFDRHEIIEIQPVGKADGIRLNSSIQYGIVPAFIGDDLIFGASEATADNLLLPAENVFVGLLKDGDSELILTWPKGKQQFRLNSAEGGRQSGMFQAAELESDGKSIYLAVESAAGIWHREVLKPGHLEKDVALEWKPPFQAKWKTQLSEAGVKTTFNFHSSKGEIWRGVPGSYNYPVWFDGDMAYFHLSKKIPPKGEAIIYCLEGQNTPPTISTPADILKVSLGRETADVILDSTGRKLRTHHRRGGDGVHRACTCGCTEAIEAIFQAKEELAKKEDVRQALGDMNFFVECHVQRIDEYRRFADDLIAYLRTAGGGSAELKAYLQTLEQIASQIPQEYEVQKENMKSPEHAAQLTRQTMALTAASGTNNLAAYQELLKAWRAMGGAQDYVVAQCHTITRKLAQEAGYLCVGDPNAVKIAEEVRAKCRRVLRNPDGYEIWSDY